MHQEANFCQKYRLDFFNANSASISKICLFNYLYLCLLCILALFFLLNTNLNFNGVMHVCARHSELKWLLAYLNHLKVHFSSSASFLWKIIRIFIPLEVCCHELRLHCPGQLSSYIDWLWIAIQITGGGYSTILRQMEMCHPNGLVCHQKSLRRGSHFDVHYIVRRGSHFTKFVQYKW